MVNHESLSTRSHSLVDRFIDDGKCGFPHPVPKRLHGFCSSVAGLTLSRASARSWRSASGTGELNSAVATISDVRYQRWRPNARTADCEIILFNISYCISCLNSWRSFHGASTAFLHLSHSLAEVTLGPSAWPKFIGGSFSQFYCCPSTCVGHWNPILPGHLHRVLHVLSQNLFFIDELLWTSAVHSFLFIYRLL